ncbi:MAG: hypothetical protein EB010_10585 [Acidimicrobiia bacterium]|nr:hypothetical protein [Acidimicrobiia bacterium]
MDECAHWVAIQKVANQISSQGLLRPHQYVRFVNVKGAGEEIWSRASGKVCFYVYRKAHLLADVSGYFAE